MRRLVLILIALAAFGLAAAPAFAQPDYFGEAVESLYRGLGGIPLPGVDISTSANALLYVVLPFLLILLVLNEVLTHVFKGPLVRAAAAVILALMTIPMGALAIVITWFYTAGAIGLVLIFGAVPLMAVSRLAREKSAEFGYTGVFSGKAVLYGTAAVGWGSVFAAAGLFHFGPGGLVLGFLVGAIAGTVLAFMEVSRRRHAAKAVAKVEEQAEEREADILAQMEMFGQRSQAVGERLKRLVEAGRPADDPAIVSLRNQLDFYTREIESLQAELERLREKEQAEIIRREPGAAVGYG